MSSTIFFRFDDGEEVSREDWLAFCAGHAITYTPHNGQNIFYAGEVEIEFGRADRGCLPRLPDGSLDFAQATPPGVAPEVTFSTFFCGPAMPEVARLAREFWIRFGGWVAASPAGTVHWSSSTHRVASVERR